MRESTNVVLLPSNNQKIVTLLCFVSRMRSKIRSIDRVNWYGPLVENGAPT